MRKIQAKSRSTFQRRSKRRGPSQAIHAPRSGLVATGKSRALSLEVISRHRQVLERSAPCAGHTTRGRNVSRSRSRGFASMDAPERHLLRVLAGHRSCSSSPAAAPSLLHQIRRELADRGQSHRLDHTGSHRCPRRNGAPPPLTRSRVGPPTRSPPGLLVFARSAECIPSKRCAPRVQRAESRPRSRRGPLRDGSTRR